MPAKFVKRLDIDKGTFHIFNQGVSGQEIFKDNSDYEEFIKYLKEYLSPPLDSSAVKQEFTIKGKTYKGVPHRTKNYNGKLNLLAYNLKPSSFHLLLEQTSNGHVEKFMRSLLTRYSMYFNKKYSRKGSLFSGPYKSVVIEQEDKYAPLLYQFHFEQNPYSSYKEYLGEKSVDWLQPKNEYLNKVNNYQPSSTELNSLAGFDLSTDNEPISGSDLNAETIQVYSNNDNGSSYSFLKISSSIAIFFLLFTLGLRNMSLPKNDRLSADIELFSNKQEQSISKPASLPTPSPKPIVAGTKTEVNKQVNYIKLKDFLSTENINIRQEPSAESPVVASAEKGDVYEFESIVSGWYKINLGDGYGYISADLVEIVKDPNQ